MLKRRYFFKTVLCVILVMTVFSAAGCSRIKFTAGLGNGTFAKINGEKVDMETAMLLLGELKYSYENIFDAGVWSEMLGDVTAEEYAKNFIRDTVEHVMLLNGMADEAGISLTQDELGRIEEAAALYYSGLSAETIDGGGFDMDTVAEYYTKLRLAQKVFYSVTDDVDTEVSTDEARVISVQYIYISTVEYDEDNNPVSLSEADKRRSEKKAQTLLEQIENGVDFVSLAKENSDDSVYALELGRGEYLKQFEDAAFELEMGKVSGVVETDIGYYIIKCINDNMESDYEKRSREIVLSRRMESFSGQYADALEGLNAEFNRSFWDETPVEQVKSGSGKLYEVYGEYFSDEDF